MSSENPQLKKAKTNVMIPSSVITHFIAQNDSETIDPKKDDSSGLPTIDLPVNTDLKQMELLINSLLQNESQVIYLILLYIFF